MHKELLQCPDCKNKYSIHNKYVLKCTECNYSIPIKDEIVYFTERFNDGKGSENFVNKLEERGVKYERFLKKKIQRPSIDAYAAFQPFNESSRAIYPFIDLIKSHLKPGDWILDTWCRTGWTSNWLSLLFPEQNILSIWEGDRDVLGYQGFNFWFSEERRNSNQYFIFCDLNEIIPIADNTIKFVYGLETLHRYKQSNIVHELLRVLTDDGILLHPHNHLSNSEPNPYFDRGERQLHGLVWDRYFNSLLKDLPHKHFIISEIDLFNLKEDQSMVSNPNMQDYNAFIGILPDNLIQKKLKPYQTPYNNLGQLHVLVNPLLKIDFKTSQVYIDNNYLNNAVGHILERHPAYHNRIKVLHKVKLQEVELKIIYWAQRVKSVKKMADLLKISNNKIIELLQALEGKEVIQVHLLSENGAKMYYYQANQNYLSLDKHTTLKSLWNSAQSSYISKPFLVVDGEENIEISHKEAQQLVNAIQMKLSEENFEKGDVICICGGLNFEQILLFWAATNLGIQVQIINANLAIETIQILIEQANAKLVFRSEKVKLNIINRGEIIFDEDNDPGKGILFSDWIAHNTDKEYSHFEVTITPTDNAVILYSSGSTGLPKAIRLTHRMLFNSAKIIADSYHWNNETIYIATSELDSISGLRNPCLATLYSGATIVLPNFSSNNFVFAILESIKRHKVNTIMTTPSLLKQFVQLGENIKEDISPLVRVISVGAILTNDLIKSFYEIFEVKILNSFGLTETSGTCVTGNPDTPFDKIYSLGKPGEGIIQIVGENDVLSMGNAGEVRVYGENVIENYMFNATNGCRIENGWLYTGDIIKYDDEGFFYFVDRKRNIVKNALGLLVYLSEIRENLIKNELINDAYVDSFLDNDLEKVAVIVAISKHNDDTSKKKVYDFVRSSIEEKKLSYKIRLVNEISYNSRGKIDNYTLKEIITENDF